jgi:RNA polymerase sigma factor (sigma-70 family)
MVQTSSFSWQKKHTEKDDVQLIEMYKATFDKEIIATLFYRYITLLQGLALKYLKDHDESADAVFEIFEILMVKLKDHDVTNFKSWLYRLSSNHCIDKLRKRKKQEIISIDSFSTQVADLSFDLIDNMKEKELILQKMNHCMNALNTDQKQSVDLFFFQEKSYNEIALLLDISWDQTRSLIQNGKRNLKNCMEQK